ncbi:tRNA 2-thiouridine(34) synthase MnmA [Porphyromonas asaccharolytica]|uniref:tRNA 2-thiouridine(34) synthase MnmA n=1 Tax=Porphyromonas asaccharolytica TaxID=28123 RepID=UPI00248E028C|nr:tRNA 2-thiouridine(34) synthase MnmA [Porphyromonas asaccharolytica]
METALYTALPRDSRIALLASGGVDSSVAMHLLVEAGFRPDLYYIRIGMQDEAGGYLDCPAEEDIELVTLLARRYDLHLEIIDLHQVYWDRVVSYTMDAVKRGLTPNPDVMCNKLIKFGAFEERCGSSYDYIATGHYATIRKTAEGLTFLGTSPDPVKDQTDFLAQIGFRQMERLLFPIGHLPKEEVRRIALEAHLVNAQRKDSQGICFLGQINYNDFIERYLGTQTGDIIDHETGEKIGEHRGYWFHTIGQRKGLGLSGGPWYVVAKDVEHNVLYASRGYDPKTQYGTIIETEEMHWLTVDPWLWTETPPDSPLEVTFKIRHTPDFTTGHLERLPSGGYQLVSSEPIQGIAAGQFATIYDPQHQLCWGSAPIRSGR